MNPWRPYPLVRLIFPFLLGILIGIYTEEPLIMPIWGDVAIFVTVAAFCFFPLPFFPYRFRGVIGFLISVFIFLAGYQVSIQNNYAYQPWFVGAQPDGMYLVVVEEPPVVKGANYKLTLGLRCRQSEKEWKKVCGNALATVKIKPGCDTLQYGDVLLLKGHFDPIAENANPFSFNFASFLKSRGITHQIFLDSHAWKKLHVAPGLALKRWAFLLRNKLLDVFRRQHITGKEFAVAAALLLGYTNGIDPDLRRDYAATGAMHILSVSGMHVGIIYLFLDFLLGFLSRSHRAKLVKMVVLLIFIWFYALLTGLSPSVLRAATMLSFVIIGRSLDRLPDMFNILSASLLLILVTNPFLIIDIGFQLSYIAVIGIVVLYKPIYELLSTDIWILNKVWSIIACSIAATLSTVPLTLFTFHQFPNYFILTNIVVVPLSSLIIYAGIIALAISYFSWLSLVVGTAFGWLVWLMNTIIHCIEGLPFSTLKGIFPDFSEMILLYFLLGIGFMFFKTKKIRYLYFGLIVIILLQVSALQFRVRRLTQSSMAIYNIQGSMAIDFIVQHGACLLFNLYDPAKAIPAFALEIVTNNATALGVKVRSIVRTERKINKTEWQYKSFQLYKRGDFIGFRNLRIAVISNKIPVSLNARIKVHYLIISGNPNVTIRRLCRIFDADEIIIDGTNANWKMKKWCAEAEILGVKCHPVKRKGAFVKEL